ncbi:expressed unknown protein [Seminavis robusta]|uniref:RNase NYN domain-containing protein n=1 Tax=Seminavis robusta TaxID=568900 RepID=A0A9N8DHK9_9STRA|nr:expressed unknown protein [Seminavis robusta]|eukprot:Sro157_g071010.1 n/a (465) ;mRNA; r:7915-9427
MPSVRPKLVQEGAPIEGSVESGADAAMGTETATTATTEVNGGKDNLFVIGAPAPAKKTINNATSLQASSSSLMNASNRSLNASLSEMNFNNNNTATTTASSNNNRRRSSATTTGKKSSLARAAKGTLINETKTVKKSVVQTSFVVGGGGGGLISDEKKSADVMMDESSSRGRKSRGTSIATSYEIPTTNPTNNTAMMEVDPKPVIATKFVVAPTSSAQAPSYIEAVTDPKEPLPVESQAKEPAVIPADPTHDNTKTTQEVEKMYGVIDLSEKAPMVVLDGANIAYAYDKAGSGGVDKPEPDARGIVVACEYFIKAGIRVLAVIPSTWMHRDPYQRILKRLDQQGILVSAPSKDDDDAYAITIARREDSKSKERENIGPGYVLSNDMFRDAMLRGKAQGGGADLVSWLMQGSTREDGATGPGRISYTFCDTGAMDDHGDKLLDLVPNPRHQLIIKAERGHFHKML